MLKLEVEVAELRQRLQRMDELETELAKLRHAAKEAAARKPGLWGYISGGDVNSG